VRRVRRWLDRTRPAGVHDPQGLARPIPARLVPGRLVPLPRRSDFGMVTAELAVAMPAVVVVLLLALAAVRLGIDEVRCVDAARLAARALARGDPAAVAAAAAARAAPGGAVVALRSGGDEVGVEVSVTRDLGGWRAFTVRGTSTAQREAP
jgi:hypothetical protein